MKDKLIKAVAKEGQVRVIVATTTNLVNEGVKLHNCAPTAAAAFGRMLTAGSLMGSMLKSEKDAVTLKILGGGSAKGVVVTSHSNAGVKGYIGNPSADLPPNDLGKLDVSGIIGKEGNLFVIRDMGLKEPYIGQVPIYTGEIGDDLAYYFTVSEQVPTAVGLGVLVDRDLSIKYAGGLIIQMMPGADEMLADLITFRLQDLGSITKAMSEGKDAEDILNFLFDDMEIKILDTMEPTYKCDCSKERVERALISLGREQLKEIRDENKTEELKCHFCNKSYKFTPEEIDEILKELN
ncbi:Hsp33 family molecular chaperone HslO [Clostridium brassicae]|uniref:33 kDa chaperonin n=1 Tax=Clostridium brassicae TaxID=2999072 RepID=A0ABT4DDH5_9CLOT|nr:Hsp33 family molecular chaperone HslO [Clostridium brassicae]MCY6960369.1 Hsp33 family molecular chaperone HslO [Clostridium brassicae]